MGSRYMRFLFVVCLGWIVFVGLIRFPEIANHMFTISLTVAEIPIPYDITQFHLPPVRGGVPVPTITPRFQELLRLVTSQARSTLLAQWAPRWARIKHPGFESCRGALVIAEYPWARHSLQPA